MFYDYFVMRGTLKCFYCEALSCYFHLKKLHGENFRIYCFRFVLNILYSYIFHGYLSAKLIEICEKGV